jgi:dTDP-4-dehydrorhamnose 3,5-epimerase
MSTLITETGLPGLLRLERPAPGENNDRVVDLEELRRVSGRDFQVRQINHSRSMAGVLRGLHAERWEKVVWVLRGTAFCAIVDLRPEQPTFGNYRLFELSEHNRQALYIPEGFANSAYAVTDIDYMYMVSKVYDGSDTTAVAWDDPDIAIPWPNPNPILSIRDKNNPTLRQLYPDRFA